MSLLKNEVKNVDTVNIRDYPKISSIDFLEGVSISIIILISTADAWLNKEWRFAYGFFSVLLDVFGPSLFIFLSALSVVFLLKKRMGISPEKSIRNSIIIRGVVLIGLGSVYNIITLHQIPFPLNFWGWNILMFVGFSQIICYYSLKLARGVRNTVGLAIILASNELRNVLFYFKDVNLWVGIAHFIIVSPVPHFPLIPFLAICFFSTTFGELLFESIILETREADRIAFRTFMRYGSIFALIGVILPFLGGRPFDTTKNLNSEEFQFINLLPIMQNQPYINVFAIPEFLVRGTSSNIFYCIGIALLILGFSFYYIDVKPMRRDISKSIVRTINSYGRASISIYIVHFIGLCLFYGSLDLIFFFVFWFGYIIVIGILMYAWNYYAEGRFSFEWFMAQLTIKGKKR